MSGIQFSGTLVLIPYNNSRGLVNTMSSSELSDLSSALSSEGENALETTEGGNISQFIKKGASTNSPAKKKRPTSPPHEYVLADNPDIAVSSKMIST